MTVSPETYEKAADVLEERGWWRHGYVPAEVEETGEGLDTCPVCVLAALNVALGHAPDSAVMLGESDVYEAGLAFANHLGVTPYPLTAGDDVSWFLGDQWNDRQVAGVEQVTGALRGYAAELKAAAA